MAARYRSYVLTVDIGLAVEHDAELLQQSFSNKLRGLAIDYFVVGLEIGSENHRYHLQGMIHCKNPVALTWLKKNVHPTAHFEPMKGTFAQASDYCKKDGKFIEEGERPLSQDEKGQKATAMWKCIAEHAKSGDLDTISLLYPKVYVSQFSSLQRISASFPNRPSDLSHTAGIWIHGISGCGKSHLVRGLGFEYYDKLLNKWWCGYRSEPIVIIDDADPKNSEHLQGLFKRWADKYSFTAEIKGSSVSLRPPVVVFTSQYSIEACFPGCSETIEALTRRCAVFHLTIANRSLLGPVIGSLVAGRINPIPQAPVLNSPVNSNQAAPPSPVWLIPDNQQGLPSSPISPVVRQSTFIRSRTPSTWSLDVACRRDLLRVLSEPDDESI